MKSRKRDEIRVNSDEICFADEIKSVQSPDEVGFHHEVISFTEGGFIPVRISWRCQLRTDLVEKSTALAVLFSGAPGGIRTLDLPVRSRALYPLSYKRIQVFFLYPNIIPQKFTFVNSKSEFL